MVPGMRSWVGLIVGALVVTAAASAGAVVRSQATTRHAAASCVRLAPLSAAAKGQLVAEAGWIQETTGVVGGSRNVSFADPINDRTLNITYSPKNTIAFELETVTRGSETIVTSVSYANRTWTTEPVGGVPSPLGPLGTSEHYRKLIANRNAVVAGTGIVDGQHALLLRVSNLQAAMASIHSDAWINATTYVPLHTDTTGAGPPDTLTYTWIPRTPSNLARTKPLIPSGFKHLGQPSGTGTSSGTGTYTVNSANPLDQQPSRCPA